jgi:hypothetical protein
MFGVLAACSAVGIAACGRAGGRARAVERPRSAPLWESEIRGEPEPRSPGSYYEQWPLLDGGPVAAPLEVGDAGTNDRFLWDTAAPDAGGVEDPQRPLRLLDPPKP